jgi:hypothetical protein
MTGQNKSQANYWWDAREKLVGRKSKRRFPKSQPTTCPHCHFSDKLSVFQSRHLPDACCTCWVMSAATNQSATCHGGWRLRSGVSVERYFNGAKTVNGRLHHGLNINAQRRSGGYASDTPQRGVQAILAKPRASTSNVFVAGQARRPSLRKPGVSDTYKGVFSGVYGCFCVSAGSAFETVNTVIYRWFAFLYLVVPFR